MESASENEVKSELNCDKKHRQERQWIWVLTEDGEWRFVLNVELNESTILMQGTIAAVASEFKQLLIILYVFTQLRLKRPDLTRDSF